MYTYRFRRRKCFHHTLKQLRRFLTLLGGTRERLHLHQVIGSLVWQSVYAVNILSLSVIREGGEGRFDINIPYCFVNNHTRTRGAPFLFFLFLILGVGSAEVSETAAAFFCSWFGSARPDNCFTTERVIRPGRAGSKSSKPSSSPSRCLRLDMWVYA